MTTEDWKNRIRPHLSSSLRTVSDRITSHEAIQSWLHQASFDAAQGLAGMPDMQAEAMAHARMEDDLNDAFPALVEAVRELTHQQGSLAMDWRPLSPSFTRIYIDFRRSFEVNLFYSLPGLTPEDVQNGFDALHAALPASDPFPNRPNEVTGLFGYANNALGVRLKEHLGDGSTRRHTASLLVPRAKREALDDLSEREAMRHVIQLLSETP